jgi:chromate transport protein ChrA
MAARWGHENRDLLGVRSFKLAMTPIVIGLLLATGWIMASSHNVVARDWPLWLLSAACAFMVWRTSLHLLWLLAAGALWAGSGWSKQNPEYGCWRCNSPDWATTSVNYCRIRPAIYPMLRRTDQPTSSAVNALTDIIRTIRRNDRRCAEIALTIHRAPITKCILPQP